jgi:hypothetical protein
MRNLAHLELSGWQRQRRGMEVGTAGARERRNDDSGHEASMKVPLLSPFVCTSVLMGGFMSDRIGENQAGAEERRVQALKERKAGGGRREAGSAHAGRSTEQAGERCWRIHKTGLGRSTEQAGEQCWMIHETGLGRSTEQTDDLLDKWAGCTG